MFGHEQNLIMQFNSSIYTDGDGLLPCTILQKLTVYLNIFIGENDAISVHSHNSFDQVPVPVGTNAIRNEPV